LQKLWLVKIKPQFIFSRQRNSQLDGLGVYMVCCWHQNTGLISWCTHDCLHSQATATESG